MAYDGSLIFNTKVDTKGFDSGTKSIQGTIGSLKSSFLKLGAAVGVAFGVKQLVAFSTQAIETASDLDEVQNVVDTAFGEMSYKMEEFADTAIETYGISKLAAKKTGSTFMAMAKGMRLAMDTASDMSVALTGLSADMASFYNVSQEEAFTALKSIFTGETEALKKYGIVMTDINLQEYARQQGIQKSVSKMTQAEKVQLRYNYVMQQTALAQGDFAKTSDGWANQTRILSERWKEFQGTIGTVLKTAFLPAIHAVNSALSVLIEYADKAAQSLLSLFGIKSGAEEKAVAKASTVTADNYEDIAESAAETAKSNDSTLASFDEINKISDSDSESSSQEPLSSSVLGTSASASGKNAKDVDTSWIDNIKTKFQSTVDYLRELWDGFKGGLKKGWDLIDFNAIKENFQRIIAELIPTASTLISGVKKILRSFVNFAGAIYGHLLAIIGKIIEILSGGIANFLEENGKKIREWIDETADKISHGFDNLTFAADVIFGAFWNALTENQEEVENSISNILTAYSDMATTIGTIFADMWVGLTEGLKNWANENSAEIETFFSDTIATITTVSDTISGIVSDLFGVLLEWWNTSGKPVWDSVVAMFLDIGQTIMHWWTAWVLPIIDMLSKKVQWLWDNHLKPLWENILEYGSSVADFISTLWNNVLSPLVNWLIDYLQPKVLNLYNFVAGVLGTLIGVIADVVGGIYKYFKGILDFFTNVFKGDWEGAMNGIIESVQGTVDVVWGIVKGVINLIIDGLNLLWGGVYQVFSGIVDGIGGAISWVGDLFGKDWGFKMPSEPPMIPKLATGTVVPANYGEFLAVLGDNKREAEVVSPLSTIEQAIRNVLGDNPQGGGNITIPIYIGQEKVDTIIVSAAQRARLAGGGY